MKTAVFHCHSISTFFKTSKTTIFFIAMLCVHSLETPDKNHTRARTRTRTHTHTHIYIYITFYNKDVKILNHMYHCYYRKLKYLF